MQSFKMFFKKTANPKAFCKKFSWSCDVAQVIKRDFFDN